MRDALTLFAALFAALFAFALPAAAQDCGTGQRAFDHLGGTTCIPQAPLRIIGLHDQSVTLALVELGAPVVGSHGRVADDGSLYLRSVDLLFGLDFQNSGIGYAGTWQAMDLEAMAAMQPDLIIGRAYDMEAREQYEAIAPTVFIPDDDPDPLAFARGVADAAGKLETWEAMLATYRANIERGRKAFPQADGATYSKIQMSDDNTFTVYAGYGGLTMVLQDLGFQRNPVAQDMADRGVAWGEEASLEILPDLQADYLFDTYTIAYGDTLADPRARFDAALPSWCDVLSACGEGRYIVVPREISTGFSFAQLNMLVHLVTTHAARAPAPSN
ncbi:MAG: hypothetical protein AAGE76_06550 [Pseudomonadota bacterium]